MATRTIRTGFGTYKNQAGDWTFGMLGDEVNVHDEDLERFDRYNPPEDEIEPQPVAETLPEAPFLDGEPTETWTVKQLEAFAAAKDIDLSGATKKDEKLALLTQHSE